MKKIVIDTLGGDNGAMPLLYGSADYMKEHSDVFCVFAGEKTETDKIMAEKGVSKDRYTVLDTDEYISNTQSPMSVFGGCDNSSMVLALEYLRDNDCAGMISAGNTGALLIGTICRLGLVKGLKRPALSSALPAVDGSYICLVDCGANVDCTPNDLYEFAKLGSAFVKSMYGIDAPRVALLSTGTEKGKGNKATKEAYALLESSALNFVGNLEGSDVLLGKADVLACDGYAGNIVLKDTEATGKIAAVMSKNILASLAPEIAESVSKKLEKAFDFNSRGGATFLGTKKTVVKMHGAANSSTAVSCIEQVLKLSESGFDTAVEKALS